VNVNGDREFAAPRKTVWEVLNDPAAMASTMPGVESFDVHDDKRWTANVKIPLGLGGLKMKVDMEKTDERELEMAVMHIKGHGVGAMMNMQTKFELSDVAGGTKMNWDADVKIAGPVGSMGQRVLQPIVNQQVQHVLGALDKRIQEAVGSQGAGDSAGGGSGTSPEPSTDAEAPPAEGPKDYGPPADSDADPAPDSGTSGADEGISPWSPDAYDEKQQ
jgi:carbon monoxide dehydrogenase subunit G